MLVALMSCDVDAVDGKCILVLVGRTDQESDFRIQVGTILSRENGHGGR